MEIFTVEGLIRMVLTAAAAAGGAWLVVKQALESHRAQRALDMRADWTVNMHNTLVQHSSLLTQIINGQLESGADEASLARWVELLGQAQLYASEDALRALHGIVAAWAAAWEKPVTDPSPALRAFVEAEQAAATVLANDFRAQLGLRNVPPELVTVGGRQHALSDGAKANLERRGITLK